MSKERARLRAQREVQLELERSRRRRQLRWRERRRAVLRALRPRLPDRRTGRLFARRTRRQRGAIGGAAAGVIALVWLYTPTLTAKIALSLLVVAAAPVLAVLVFDRRI